MLIHRSKKRNTNPTVEWRTDSDGGLHAFKFRVPTAFLSALGIHYTERINPLPTKAARDAAITRGLSKNDVKRITVTRTCWTRSRRALYDFHANDLITTRDGLFSVQIIYVGSEHAGDAAVPQHRRMIRFALFSDRTKACETACTQHQFARMLRTGRLSLLGIDLTKRIFPSDMDILKLPPHESQAELAF